MRKIAFVILLLSFLFSCKVNERIGNINFSYLYKQTLVDNAPKFVAHFINDSTCRIYYKIPPGALVYEKDEDSEKYIANYSLVFKMFESYKAKVLLDSATQFRVDTNILEKPKTIIDSIDLKKPLFDKSILKIVFIDKNQQSKIEDIVILNAKKGSRYYFKIEDGDSQLMFNKYIYNGSFSVRTNLKAEKLFVNYYNRKFPIAKPPFAYNEMKPFDYTPDSIFEIRMNNSKSDMINLTMDGFYHLQIDTAKKEGLTIFKYYNGFPEVINSKQLFEPIRYISSLKEYKYIKEKPILKKAIDEFWIELAGNPIRAKSMILEYYKRIEEANILFSSYTEGWRTDKGMIYVVFGMPRAVFKDIEVEEWVYGEATHPKAINFYFIKVINPFTDYDYYLTRNKSYKDPWYMAVDRIRR